MRSNWLLVFILLAGAVSLALFVTVSSRTPAGDEVPETPLPTATPAPTQPVLDSNREPARKPTLEMQASAPTQLGRGTHNLSDDYFKPQSLEESRAGMKNILGLAIAQMSASSSQDSGEPAQDQTKGGSGNE